MQRALINIQIVITLGPVTESLGTVMAAVTRVIVSMGDAALIYRVELYLLALN